MLASPVTASEAEGSSARACLYSCSASENFSCFSSRSPAAKCGSGSFGCKCRSLPVGSKGFLRVRGFEHMRQREPRPRLSLGDVAGGFELRRGPQKLFGIGLAALGKLQSQIQIRFKNIRFRRHRFAIGGNRIVDLARDRSPRSRDRTTPRSSPGRRSPLCATGARPPA